MCQYLRKILNFSLALALVVFIFLIRNDTSINYFNEKLTQEEKNKFFYNSGTNSLIKPSVNQFMIKQTIY